MTLLGKILTALVLVMSIVFMTLATMVYATHKNWKLVALNPKPGASGHDETFGEVGLKYQVEDHYLTVKQLRTQLEELKSKLAAERGARRMAIQQLQTKSGQLQSSLQTQQQLLDARIAENGQLQENLKLLATQNAALVTEVEDLKNKNRIARADRDEQFKLVVSLTDMIHKHEGMRERLKERQTQLAQDIVNMKRVMDAKGITENDPIDNIPPKIDGQVTELGKRNKNYIEISLGSDDGIRTGHELDVFRGQLYLGRVVIREVTSNSAVAEIIPALRRGPIRKGDSVTTRFG